MEYRLEIWRQENSDSPGRFQTILYQTGDERETVATALTNINNTPGMQDINGNPVGEIGWECSCLQKKCGACAVVINGTPGLACDSFLRNYIRKKTIKLAPLSKFPLIRDLWVDRSILRQDLKDLGLTAAGDFAFTDRNNDTAFEASKCLQCGCCLEVCPNYVPGGKFFGAAGYVPETKFLTALSSEEAKRLKPAYMTHIYGGCGKSLACKDICPAGIDIDRLLSRSNAVAVWGRKK